MDLAKLLLEELHTWNDAIGSELEQNLKSLTELKVKNVYRFSSKLKCLIRIGEHTNTAFRLAFAWGYI